MENPVGGFRYLTQSPLRDGHFSSSGYDWRSIHSSGKTLLVHAIPRLMQKKADEGLEILESLLLFFFNKRFLYRRIVIECFFSLNVSLFLFFLATYSGLTFF